MLLYGINQLIGANYSQPFSCYHICNHHSYQFYHHLRFQAKPGSYYLRIRAGYLRTAVRLREKFKMMDGLHELQQEYKQINTRLT